MSAPVPGAAVPAEPLEPTEALEAAPPQVRLLLGAVFLVYLGQMTLNPIIGPLAREMHMPEWQIGATISTAAVMVVLTSRGWGRRSQSWGRKKVLTWAFALATGAMILFALVGILGMRGVLAGVPLFVAVALLRGVAFGTAIAAVPPTAQAYIADVTPDEAARVKGMAGVGAVQGVAMVGGAVAGGLLATLGMVAPLVAVPALLAIGLLVVAFGLRREPATTLVADPAHVSPRDPRVLAFLVVGFLLFTALGFVQVITGFVVQDRLGLDAASAGALTGGALLAAGLGMIVAQAVVVPRCGWSPVRLLRVGSAIALLGFAVYVPDLGLAGILAAMVLVGLGLGLAMPGFSAGPSLLVSREEQGGLAGLVGATMGLTFVVAPVAGTSLYSLGHPLPALAGTVFAALALLTLWAHPAFARARHATDTTTTPREDLP